MQRRGGGPRGGAPMEKAQDFGGTMRKLLRYIRKHRLMMLLVIFLAVAATLLNIFSPRVIGTITDRLVNDYVTMTLYDTVSEQYDGAIPQELTGEAVLSAFPPEALERINAAQRAQFGAQDLRARPTVDFDAIARTIGLLVCIYVAASLLSYLQGFFMAGISAKVTYSFRRDISKKINRLPLRYFDRLTFGDVLSRITNDVDLVSQTLNESLTQMVTSVVMLVGVIIMMFSISWQLTLVALAILPISMLLISLVVSRSQKYFAGQQQALGDLNGYIEESYSGHSVIRAFGAGKRFTKVFSQHNQTLYDNAWKGQFFSGLMGPLMGFVGNLGYIGVCVVGGLLALSGKSTIGDIQAFIQYMRQFNQPIAQLASVTNTLQSTAAAAERVFDFLDEADETADPAMPLMPERTQGAVSFDHVSFGYDAGRTIIKDFSIDIQPGQTVAIVGPTGAGKTTLVNLLMRFYDIDAGGIAIDGVNTRDMTRRDVRALFGMVLQDAWLFSGTIRDNIMYAKPDATPQELQKAIRAGQVEHLIQSMPGGLDMELTEDASNISQGQRQLLTIARAMLADPPMMILDEATSSVDTRTEVLIQKAMNSLLTGRTSFIIAHRLSTIRNADTILVMNQGNIVEQGTHDQLIKAQGFYYELYNSQFTGAQSA